MRFTFLISNFSIKKCQGKVIGLWLHNKKFGATFTFHEGSENTPFTIHFSFFLGWELIEPTLEELDQKMREAETESHEVQL